MKYKNIFSPAKIGNLMLKNRVIMAPLGSRLTNENGGVTEGMRQFYSLRAKGGVAAIVIEAAGIDYPEAVGKPNHLRINDDSLIPGHALLAESIHEQGSLAISMLWHAGINKGSLEGLLPVAPSAILNKNTGIVPRELTKEDILGIENKFVEAAIRAKNCGYDAIELHGGHGYLISSFISELTNQRSDEYGGTFENRIRFALEIIAKIKEKIGNNFPILIRINGSDFEKGGIDIEMAVAFSQALEKAGIAAIDVSAGVYNSVDKMIEPMSYGEGWKVYLAEEIKKHVSIPVIGVGVFRSPNVVEKTLDDQKVDFVALGRELLCEPNWVNKVKNGQVEHLLKCISCNACFAQIGKNLPLRCGINPQAGRESIIVEPVEKTEQKKIAVIGAGPGGITAALTAAKRGHQVTIFEKENQIGGQLELAIMPPGKDKIIDYLNYLKIEIENSSVTCVLNHEFIASEAKDFDEVIIATGATCRCLPLKGENLVNTKLSWEILKTDPKEFANKNIIVLGGGFVGCETALFLKTNGAKTVSIVELVSALGGDVDAITRKKMLSELEESQVKAYLSNSIFELKPGKALLKEDPKEIACDLLVLAIGSKPNSYLREELFDQGIFTYCVGDSNKIGRIKEAVSTGFEATLNL